VLAVMFFHPIAGRWRPACLRVATASVETVSPPSELYRNTTGRSRPPMATAAQRGTVAYPGRGRPFGHASEVLPGVIPSGARNLSGFFAPSMAENLQRDSSSPAATGSSE